MLTLNLPKSKEVCERLRDYLSRTGLTHVDFARRINYSPVTVHAFIQGRYERMAGNDGSFRKAAVQFMDTYQIAEQSLELGTLYETKNVKLLREYFYTALDRRKAIYVHGDPGSQKSFTLQRLVQQLNETELSKNGHGRRAFYIYCAQGVKTPTQLMREVAIACGLDVGSDHRRVIRNLRFDFRNRRVLFVFDEAQHLNVECFETVRELYDLPPHFGLLFAGSHELQTAFIKNALQLEQWNSRFIYGTPLPGLDEEEAAEIVANELGDLKRATFEKLISKCRAKSLRSKGQFEYISARRLFEVIEPLKAKLAGRSKEVSA